MRILKRLLFFVARYISSIFLFAFSVTIGVFFKKCRWVIQLICREFHLGFLGEVEYSHRLLLPKISATEFLVDGIIEICELKKDFASTLLSEMVVLNSIIKKYNPKTIFEIGTFEGKTTLNFALSSQDDATIYTLDIPKEQVDTTKFPLPDSEKGGIINKTEIGYIFVSASEIRYPQKRKIVQLSGDSAIFDYTPYFNSMDMVFIDGAHSYEYVENDTNVALSLIRNGKGTIIWHDYTIYGAIAKFLHKFKSRHPNYNILHIKDTTMVILRID